MRAISKKRRAQPADVEFSDDVRAQVDARAGWVCEVCKFYLIVEYHHRLRRSQGGRGDLANALGLCLKCHANVHAHPEDSYKRGWLIKPGRVNMGLKVKP